MSKSHLTSILIMSCVIWLSGCAAPKSIFPVSISYSKIEAKQASKPETIIVNPFIDNRNINQTPYLGEIFEPVNMYPGPPIPVPLKSGRFIVEKNNTNISVVFTNLFAAALKSVGYNVLINTLSADMQSKISSIPQHAVLIGKVNEFWLTPSWTTTQSIRIELKLYNEKGTRLVWEKEIHVEHSQFVGLWSSDAFEEIIQKALDKTSARAIKEFESDEFQQKVSDNYSYPR